MRKILLIARSEPLETQLGSVLGSPKLVARATSWGDAHSILSRNSPAAVLVSGEFAQLAMAPQLVQLNDVLTKDNKSAYLLADPKDPTIQSLAGMFDAIKDVLPTPEESAQWQQLRSLLTPHLGPDNSPTTTSRPPRHGAASAGQPRSAGSDKRDQAPLEVIIRLPQVRSGNLEKISLTRVLYCLHARRETGTLELRSGSMVRRFALVDGRFTEAPDHHDAAALTSAYAWPRGSFVFQANAAISGSPTSLYQIMINGLVTHRPQRQIMDGLMPRMKLFLVTTQFCNQRREQLSWDVLQRFLQLSDGSRTLEQVFSQMGHQVTEGFRAAAFARDTDLVIFRDQPTSHQAQVEYDQLSTSTSAPTKSKSELATGSNTGRLSLEQQLQAFHDNLQRMNSHEIFGVWKGCGREIVKETYYRLIKEHHPDVYGGNVSSNIRRLAQRIFILIRKAYADLMKVEGDQTVAPPDPEADASHRGRDPIPTLQFSVEDSEGSETGEAQPLGSGDNSSSQQIPRRRPRQTTPIAMGRTPTGQHPSLERQQQLREEKTAALK